MVFVKIDGAGRIVVPAEIRQELGLEKDTPLHLTKVGTMICLQKASEFFIQREKKNEGEK